MSDPKEYREHAERCFQMAAATTDRQTRINLVERAKTWLLIAHLFEKSQVTRMDPLVETTRATLH